MAITPSGIAMVATPVINPSGGNFTSSVLVNLSTSTSGATIHYTTDGNMPSETSGIVYSGPFSLSSSATINAIAFDPTGTMADSAVATAFFNFGIPTTYNFSTATSGNGQGSVQRPAGSLPVLRYLPAAQL